jgi:hypothetical protein
MHNSTWIDLATRILSFRQSTYSYSLAASAAAHRMYDITTNAARGSSGRCSMDC